MAAAATAEKVEGEGVKWMRRSWGGGGEFTLTAGRSSAHTHTCY